MPRIKTTYRPAPPPAPGGRARTAGSARRLASHRLPPASTSRVVGSNQGGIKQSRPPVKRSTPPMATRSQGPAPWVGAFREIGNSNSRADDDPTEEEYREIERMERADRRREKRLARPSASQYENTHRDFKADKYECLKLRLMFNHTLDDLRGLASELRVQQRSRLKKIQLANEIARILLDYEQEY